MFIFTLTSVSLTIIPNITNYYCSKNLSLYEGYFSIVILSNQQYSCLKIFNLIPRCSAITIFLPENYNRKRSTD